MQKTMAPAAVIENAVHLACRAPSYHNTQPWTWVLDTDGLQLYVDADRVASTDAGGRQALISCGAALDHLRVAMAAAGHDSVVEYYPDPQQTTHLATVTFAPSSRVTTAHRRRADAILRRRSDRLPFAPPSDWTEIGLMTRRDALCDDMCAVDVVAQSDRDDLARASDLTEALRLYDTAYHAELSWWTAPYEVFDGIPHNALVSAAEADRVAVGRSFPVTRHEERRRDVGDDRSTILVISALADTRRDILGCGETLSAVLLDATVAGLATCTVSHLTEVEAARDIVAGITGRSLPQVMVRVGRAPVLEETPAPTPRRPLSEVLHVRLDRDQRPPR
jgi:hypothetical protein